MEGFWGEVPVSTTSALRGVLVPLWASLHLTGMPHVGVCNRLDGTRTPWVGVGGFSPGVAEI